MDLQRSPDRSSIRCTKVVSWLTPPTAPSTSPLTPTDRLWLPAPPIAS
ncbi:MAG: hypothetical protein HC865_25655 [Cyanobacteria bacterium RU_5_0]|nr:hypothetical protein [Cyanobacteria bacterium RU_5_0]